MQAWLRKRGKLHAVVELRITGRHAATMLAGEAGLHGLDGGSEVRDVAVVSSPSAAEDAARRVRLRFRQSLPRQRQVLIHRDRLRDYVLGRQTSVGSLDRQLEALIRDRMLAKLFPGGSR